MTPLERIRTSGYSPDELLQTAHLLRCYGHFSLADLCEDEAACQEAVRAYWCRARASRVEIGDPRD